MNYRHKNVKAYLQTRRVAHGGGGEQTGREMGPQIWRESKEKCVKTPASTPLMWWTGIKMDAHVGVTEG